MSSKRMHFIILIVLFSLSVYYPPLNRACMMSIIVLNFCFIISKSSVGLSVMSTMVMGNEMYSLINATACIIGLVISKSKTIGISRKGVNKSFCVVVLIILVNSIINGIINHSLINVLFYVTYIFLLWMCYIVFREVLSVSDAIKTTQKIIIIEVIVTIIRIFLGHKIVPSDFFAGTMNNAHFFGNWLIASMIFLTSEYIKRKNNEIFFSKFSYISCMIAMLIMLYLTDAKGIILSFVFGFVLYIFVRFISLRKKNAILWTIFGMYIGFAFFVWLCSVPFIKDYLQNVIPVYSDYLYKDGWNGRYKYAYGTLFDSMAGLRVLFGFGLGQYGSRVSNAFAYNSMWRSDNFLNNFIAENFSPHYVEQYVKYISYYNQELVNQIQWRSAVLTYPFSSFLSVLSETGAIGVILISKQINDMFIKSDNRFLMIYFLSICIFDLYFDNFPCVIPIIIFLGVYRR